MKINTIKFLNLDDEIINLDLVKKDEEFLIQLRKENYTSNVKRFIYDESIAINIFVNHVKTLENNSDLRRI